MKALKRAYSTKQYFSASYLFNFKMSEKLKVVVEDGQRSQMPPWGAVKLDTMESVEDCRQTTDQAMAVDSGAMECRTITPPPRLPEQPEAPADVSPASEDGEIAIAIRVKKKKKKGQ